MLAPTWLPKQFSGVYGVLAIESKDAKAARARKLKLKKESFGGEIYVLCFGSLFCVERIALVDGSDQ
jgi:hypothetical protein